MPFCHTRLRGRKQRNSKYPWKLDKLGDHIRKKRLELGLLQKDLAGKIGVDQGTACRWETNETSPPIRFIPKIVDFLGYNPLPAPKTFPEELLAARRALGLTQRGMAKRLGVDPTTILLWERGKRRPSKKLLPVVQSLLRRGT
ncbi:MAG: helix-turn-helix transcriptional regulator [Deltaproteobacteria bacterium]|nr:helix-turn-helix transcriptional regulator [Deltaproteobacteria bacterium]